MSKFRKKPVVVEAQQWFKNGDHPEGNREVLKDALGNSFMGEGKIVRYFRRPDINGLKRCENCSKPMNMHGWIYTLEGGYTVCPGDYIITGVAGDKYPCKPDIFEKTYEPVKD